MSRFDYVKYDDTHTAKQVEAKKVCIELEKEINKLPGGRYQSLAMTKLEECYMYIGKSIRDMQIEAGGDSTCETDSRSNI